MLSLKECLDYCDVNPDELAAIAEHEHVPVIVAAELEQFLSSTPAGTAELRRIIVDSIGAAQRRGDVLHALRLTAVLDALPASAPAGEPRLHGDSI